MSGDLLRARRATAALLAAATITACHDDRGRVPSIATPPAAAPPPPDAIPSAFNAPLEYDFTPVMRTVERVVPTTFGSLDSLHQMGDDASKHYAYEATRSPFTVFADGKLMHLRTTLSYAARGYYKPPIGPTIGTGCGSGNGRPRIAVELVTPLTLTPDWHLHSAVRLARMAPASSSPHDRCPVTILRYDVTDRVIDAARSALVAHLPAIDQRIDDVDLTDRFAGWWKLLERPIQLTDGVWLLLDPRRLRLGQVSGAGHVLTVEAGLDAYPRVITGAEPRPSDTPLPRLAHDTSAGAFHIVLDGIVDYVTASRALTDALRGKAVSEAGHTVAVSNAIVSPATRGRIALAIAFTGDASGTLRFVGTPVYDARRGEITVPDLDYDLETDNDLINAYAWLRSDALRATFRERARIPTAPVIDRGRQLLTAGLNRKIGDAVTLRATVDSVAVRGMYVTMPGLLVRVEATGTADVSVQQTH